MKNHDAFAYLSEDDATKDVPKRFQVAGEYSHLLRSDESLDALFDGRLKILQSRAGYRFSLDALLVSRFAVVRPNEHAVDLGAGNGVVSLILAGFHPRVTITAVEFQAALAERAARNVKLNRLEKQIQIRRGDGNLRMEARQDQ